jgi:hypothetical protein
MEDIMKCPKCQSDNKEGANFCGECGAKLSLICPQCNSENDPGNKFCNECCQNLTQPKELSFDEKLEKIQKYLLGGLTEKIMSLTQKIPIMNMLFLMKKVPIISGTNMRIGQTQSPFQTTGSQPIQVNGNAGKPFKGITW